MNDNDKMVIDLLSRRMETHPDEPMNYNGIPYARAHVHMFETPENQTRLEEYTDDKGIIEFSNIICGEYIIRIEKDGYISNEISVHVVQDVNLPETINIFPVIPEEEPPTSLEEPEPSEFTSTINRPNTMSPQLIIRIVIIAAFIALILVIMFYPDKLRALA